LKTAAAIIYLVTLSLICAGQMKVPLLQKQEAPTFVCSTFVNMVKNRNYQDAGAFLLGYDKKSCSNPEFILAQARLFASDFNFAEAEKLLESLTNQFPDNALYQKEWNHMVQLSTKAGEFLPVFLKPTVGLSSGGNQIIAWVNDTIPLMLTERQTETTYFPIKTEGIPVMQFDSADFHQYPYLQGMTSALTSKRYEEFGPGVFLPDSSLILTALHRMPYASKTKADQLKLVAFDSKKKFEDALSISDCKCNTAYPAFNSQDSTLVFSSDREGGFGGMDLWKSQLKKGKWSDPENLGPQINSEGHELMPTIWGDTLFFSSNKLFSGFGGYDLYGYRFSKAEVWNLGLPLNGPYDEHGMYVTGPGSGFIVSNRTGSDQGNDIFKAKWTVIKEFFGMLKGQISSTADLSGKEVQLLSDDGAILQKAVINAQGKFSFKHIKGQEAYRIEVTTTKLPNGSRLQLYDVSDKLIIDVTSRENRGFSFMLLTPEDYFIEKIANDDTSILSVDIFGKVADDSSKEMGGLKIVLLDSLGDVIGNTFTNADGNFVFESVRPNDSYVIITEVLNVNSVIHIVDNEGTVINSIKPNESNEYVYVRLTSSDKVITLTNELQQRVRISDKDQFDIGHIYFGLNEFEIDDNGAQSLVRLITILKGNQHVFVDMSGHTDSKGADEYNLKLSQFRIDAVIRFLVSGGIDESRLDGTGYGERKILNHCKDGLECSEEEHAKNRRTEFRLFEKD